ncbi:Vps62-related protein [Kitasatospora sp. NPDC093102]|uniref:Vps62-related protein n=1 Tax=Kitasatospora sp. NPDC093102 TaxID=3155069 RepID=UPI0034247FD4
MAVGSKVYGDLELAFTDKFEWCYDNDATSCPDWVSFWRPLPPEGFHALGTVVVPARGAANLKPKADGPMSDEHIVALCVKDAGTTEDGKLPPLARPVDYEEVWNDQGSYGYHRGSVWRPVAPEGYVALGCVAPVYSYDKPPLDAIMCVREDLTHAARPVKAFENHKSKGKDVGVWFNDVPQSYTPEDAGDTSQFLIAPNTFAAHPKYATPKFLTEMNVLRLTVDAGGSLPTEYPQLEGRELPPERTMEALASTLWLPFTAVRDEAKPVPWKLQKSPFYKVERRVSWLRLAFLNNDTDSDQKESIALTTGLEKEQTSNWNTSLGFSLNYTSGVSFGASATVTVGFSMEYSFGGSVSTKSLESKTITRELTVKPGTAAAAWTGSHTVQVKRADNSRVGPTLELKTASVHFDQYPDPEKESDE